MNIKYWDRHSIKIFEDADGNIIIVESKQFRGRAFQLNKANPKTGLPAQMTDDYIKWQADKMSKHTDPRIAATGRRIKLAIRERKVKKVVAGIDRENQNIIYVPIN